MISCRTQISTLATIQTTSIAKGRTSTTTTSSKIWQTQILTRLSIMLERIRKLQCTKKCLIMQAQIIIIKMVQRARVKFLRPREMAAHSPNLCKLIRIRKNPTRIITSIYLIYWPAITKLQLLVVIHFI